MSVYVLNLLTYSPTVSTTSCLNPDKLWFFLLLSKFYLATSDLDSYIYDQMLKIIWWRFTWFAVPAVLQLYWHSL